MRFAVSLRRSADPQAKQEWELKHFSSLNFTSDPSPDTRMSAVRGNIEMGLADPPSGQRQSRGL